MSYKFGIAWRDGDGELKKSKPKWNSVDETRECIRRIEERTGIKHYLYVNDEDDSDKFDELKSVLYSAVDKVYQVIVDGGIEDQIVGPGKAYNSKSDLESVIALSLLLPACRQDKK